MNSEPIPTMAAIAVAVFADLQDGTLSRSIITFLVIFQWRLIP